MSIFTQLYSRPQSDELLAVSGSDFFVFNARQVMHNGAVLVSSLSDSDRLSADQCILVSGHKSSISVAGFNEDGSLAATFSDDKQLKVWRTSDWECTTSLVAPKRVNALAFDASGCLLYLADKFGDVYRLDVSCTEPAVGQPILGHVSLITCMTLSPDGKYILTADRDEKVRVTQTANTDSVWAFCLGHTKFVSALNIPRYCPTVLVSGGGDGYIMVWNYAEARAIQSIPLAEHVREHWQSKDGTSFEESFAVRHILDIPQTQQTVVCLESVRALVILQWIPDEGRYSESLTVIPTPAVPVAAAIDRHGQVWYSVEGDDDQLAGLLYSTNSSTEHPLRSTVQYLRPKLSLTAVPVSSQLRKQS